MRMWAFWLWLLVGLVSPVWSQNSPTREALWEKTEPNGNTDVLRFTFPIEGGPIRGQRVSTHKMPLGHDNFTTVTLEYFIQGEFSGGDGGTIRAYLVDKGGDRTPLTGVLRADGTGRLGLWAVRFVPFEGGGCGCNLNLGLYGEAIRKKLVGNLLKATSQELYTRFLSGSENLLSAFLGQLQRWRVDPARLKLAGLVDARPPGRMAPDFLDKLQRGFENSRMGEVSAGCKMLAKMGSNVVLTLNLLQATEAATAGDFSKAGLGIAAEAVKSYGSGAAWAIVLGQAVKADWDAFAERVHNKYFRDFYVKLYYQGGGKRLSKQRWQDGRKARLKAFMEDALQNLDMGGVNGAQFRQMLIDFAAYKLERKLTRADFDLTEDGKALRSRASASVLAALFHDYERFYQAEVEFSVTRHLGIEQARQQVKLAGETERALDAATRGDFSVAWPHGKQCSKFRGIYLEAVKDLKGRGLLEK
jgi:hypothetical protein